MAKYIIVPNNEEECWELRQVGGINDDGEPLDVIIARFYDVGAGGRSPLGDLLCEMLNDTSRRIDNA